MNFNFIKTNEEKPVHATKGFIMKHDRAIFTTALKRTITEKGRQSQPGRRKRGTRLTQHHFPRERGKGKRKKRIATCTCNSPKYKAAVDGFGAEH